MLYVFRELLLKYELVEPTSNDIINKLFNDNFTKEELDDLSKIPAIVVHPTNSVINSILLLYYSKLDIYNNIKIRYESNSDFEYPTCSELAKYLPEIMDAIKEVKLILPNEVSKYNKLIAKRQEYDDQERTCKTKLWKYINNK